MTYSAGSTPGRASQFTNLKGSLETPSGEGAAAHQSRGRGTLTSHTPRPVQLKDSSQSSHVELRLQRWERGRARENAHTSLSQPFLPLMSQSASRSHGEMARTCPFHSGGTFVREPRLLPEWWGRPRAGRARGRSTLSNYWRREQSQLQEGPGLSQGNSPTPGLPALTCPAESRSCPRRPAPSSVQPALRARPLQRHTSMRERQENSATKRTHCSVHKLFQQALPVT